MKIKTSGMISKLSVSSVLLAGALLLATSCQTTISAANKAGPEKSGSELWAVNCRRCHNFRSPSDFSDSEWNAITFHMRVRANLTGDEYRLIRDFLEASN